MICDEKTNGVDTIKQNKIECIKSLISEVSDEMIKSINSVFKTQNMTDKDWTKIEKFVKKNKSKLK